MKSSKHICFINPSVGKLLDSVGGATGGAETQILIFAQQLANQHKTVSVITRLPQKLPDFTKDGIHWYSTPFTYLGGPNRYIIRDWLHLSRLIFHIRPDIIVIKHPRHLIFLLGLLQCFLGVRLFFHAAIDKDALIGSYDGKSRIGAILYRSGLKMVSGILAQTDHQKAALKGLTTAPVWQLSSVYTNLPSGNKPFSSDTPYVLWVGSNSSRKRPQVFWEIAQKFPDLQFVMVYSPGDGTGGIDENSGPSNLIYVSSCPRQKISQYYLGAMLLLSTSALEGFPNVFLESWSLGKPVLSLSIDPDCVISRHKLGRVAYDIDSLCNELEVLSADPKLRKELGEKGRSYVKQTHSSDVVITKFLEIVDS